MLWISETLDSCVSQEEFQWILVSSHIECEPLDRCVSQEEFQWILISSHIEKNIKVINLRYLFFVISGNISSQYMLDYMHFPATQNQIYTGSFLPLHSSLLGVTESLSP